MGPSYYLLFFMKSILVVYDLARLFLGCRRNPNAYASVKSGLKLDALYKSSAHISNPLGWDWCRFVGCVCVTREFLVGRKFDLAFNATRYFVIWWQTKLRFFSPRGNKNLQQRILLLHKQDLFCTRNQRRQFLAPPELVICARARTKVVNCQPN